MYNSLGYMTLFGNYTDREFCKTSYISCRIIYKNRFSYQKHDAPPRHKLWFDEALVLWMLKIAFIHTPKCVVFCFSNLAEFPNNRMNYFFQPQLVPYASQFAARQSATLRPCTWNYWKITNRSRAIERGLGADNNLTAHFSLHLGNPRATI